MPNFFEKLQKLKKPQRFIIVFSIISLLAVLSIIFIVKNFQARVKDFNRNESLIKEIDFPEFKQELSNSFESLEETFKELEGLDQELEELEKLGVQVNSTSSTTSLE